MGAKAHFRDLGMDPPTGRILSRLKGVTKSGKGWTALCPAHDDSKNSLSIGEGKDGCALLKCHAGCEVEAIVEALGLAVKDLFLQQGGGGGIPRKPRATVQPGLTLAQYAKAKRLPVEFLEGLGLSDLVYNGSPDIRIPYKDRKGNEVAIRFRLSLDGDNRFRWKTGDKPCLYGLWRPAQPGSVVLVEGESDCHTLWSHDIPALGLPGAGNWKEKRDADHFDEFDKIYVVIEPDKGGEAVRKWLTESRIRDRVSLVNLGEYKDVSGLYLADPEKFKGQWKAKIAASEPWSEAEKEKREAERKAAWEQCEDLAQEPRILDRLIEDYRQCGVIGEDRNGKLQYLALTSRIFDRPISVAIKGPSSSGKSFPLEQILKFFPDDTYIVRTGMSDKALAYGEEPLSHKFLVISEAAGMESDMQSYFIRTLLSEGFIRYQTVDQTDEGSKARVIEREGPTGLIVTTTKVSLHPENETRLLSLTANDTREQTAAILDELANEGRDNGTVDFERWHALQVWIGSGETKVTIPFGPILAKSIKPVAVRLRRDFQHVLSLVRAHAVLHQVARKRDGNGKIVATLDDYAAIRELVADILAEGVEATVPSTVRETVEAVEKIANDEGVTAKAIGERLELDRTAAQRRCQQAKKLGYLKNLETQKGRPGKYVLGDPMPDDIEILPTVETLRGCMVVSETAGIPAPPPPSEDEFEREERLAIQEYGGG